MSNKQSNGAGTHQLLPGLVLASVALAVVFASGARAHDPPIVSVGPVSSGGNTASGSVDSVDKPARASTISTPWPIQQQPNRAAH